MTVRSAPTAPVSRDAGRRHVVVAVVAGVLLAVFWFTRMEWSADMRLWRAFGDAAIVLLLLALAIGPLSRLHPRGVLLLPWRRQVGIWAAVMAVVHSVLIIDGWARWSVQRFLGYEFVPQLGREARMEPGFGLANLVGLVAVLWMIVLLATSSDRAVSFLGPQSWKWVHGGANVVFYLAILHSGYFLFVHYTESFHRGVPPPNWFRAPLLVMAAALLVLQWGTFWQTVIRRRHGRSGARA